jgi:hypothetical protein
MVPGYTSMLDARETFYMVSRYRTYSIRNALLKLF